MKRSVLIAAIATLLSLAAGPAFALQIFVSNGVSPDSKFTVVTSESTSMAHVIDNAALKLIANVLVDSRPREAKFTPDGKQVWVSSEVGGSVSVVDVATWRLIKKIRFDVTGVRPQLLQPVGMEFTKDGKYLFVALGPANRVAVIDPKTYEVKDYILVGQRRISSSRPTRPRSSSPTVSPTT